MCGIAGFIDFKKKSSEGILESMVKTMNHRGPDDYGTEMYHFSNAVVGLGHARLSIIDLSFAGHQPMHFKNFSIAFNGEIYNYQEIKKELVGLGHSFTTGTDTEVILHAYAQWNRQMVDRFIGMFAIVILDIQAQEVLFFRDRAGVKPLYYYWKDDLFLFSSELKAFHKHLKFEKVINKEALGMFFQNVDHAYIPAPFTIFLDTHKLEPGHQLSLDLKNRKFEIKKYWDVERFYKFKKKEISYKDAKEQVHKLLVSACNYRMVADVPVGVFLSGGYDSTAVTAILQKENVNKLKTFTIGFEEGNNEATYARQTAEFLGTDHTEYFCSTKEAKEIIPTLPIHFDEPFADSSAIPTILVSRLAKKQVSVALSADAGDEIFAGYSNYEKLSHNLQLLNKLPGFLKPTTKQLIDIGQTIIPSTFYEYKHKLKSVGKSLNKDRLVQAVSLYQSMNIMPDGFLRHLFSKDFKFSTFPCYSYTNGIVNELERVLAIDYKTYLQNDILTKVDRATMSVSLEGREPLLDHRLIEFVAPLPFEYKYDGLTTKRILKDIVHDYVPKEMMNRPKAGFSLPIFTWLAGELSFLLDEYLNDDAVAETGLFNVSFVSKQVRLFKQGKLHYKPFIWKLLMFQMWYKRWMR